MPDEVIILLSPDAESLSLVAHAIERAGHRVCLCTTADRSKGTAQWSDASCAIVDLRSPGVSGAALLHSIHQNYPHLPVIFVASRPPVVRVVEAMKSGAFDFFEIPVDVAKLISRVDEAVQHHHRALSAYAEMRRVTELLATLTKRENQLLGLIVEGMTTKEIGFELGIREVTVDFHRRNLYRKMGVENAVLLTRLMESHRHALLRSRV